MSISLRFFVVLSLVNAVSLQGAVGAQEWACKEDAQKHCAGVKPGGGAIDKCLKEHNAELSGACRDQLEKTNRAVAQFTQACGEDAKKFCSGVKAGGGRLAKCLAQKFDSLSSTCQQTMTEMKQQR